MPPDEFDETTARSSARVRVVHRAGVTWRIYESRLGNYDRRAGPHLIFESEAVVRRVRVPPEDWYTLSDDALMALSDRP